MSLINLRPRHSQKNKRQTTQLNNLIQNQKQKYRNLCTIVVHMSKIEEIKVLKVRSLTMNKYSLPLILRDIKSGDPRVGK